MSVTRRGRHGLRPARRQPPPLALERAKARLAEAGLDPLPAITPHSLRRTFASGLIAIGRDVGHVMDQMGHEDAGFTLGCYRKAMKRRDGELERLKALFAGEPLPALSRTAGECVTRATG